MNNKKQKQLFKVVLWVLSIISLLFFYVNYALDCNANGDGECYFDTKNCNIYITSEKYYIVRVDIMKDKNHCKIRLKNQFFNTQSIRVCVKDERYQYENDFCCMKMNQSYSIIVYTHKIVDLKLVKEERYTVDLDRSSWGKLVKMKPMRI